MIKTTADLRGKTRIKDKKERTTDSRGWTRIKSKCGGPRLARNARFARGDGRRIVDFDPTQAELGWGTRLSTIDPTPPMSRLAPLHDWGTQEYRSVEW